MSEPPGRIHGSHPFLPGDDDRDPVRRLRGRLTAPVTLWTAGEDEPAGLTVSSVLVVQAEPSLVLGLVGEDSDLLEAVESTGRFTVQVLDWEHRDLADAFAGVRPAPGGPFRRQDWTRTDWGPVLASVATWAGCRLRDVRAAGWSRLVEGELEHVVTGEPRRPLLWHRGRYRRLDVAERPRRDGPSAL